MPQVKIQDLKVGDIIIADGGFTCMSAGPKEVKSDSQGLYVDCSEYGHYLDGQVDDESGILVGFSKEE